VGVNIRAINDAEPDRPRVSIGGNVLTLISGGFCMWCCGFLSKEKLDAELAGPNRNYFENRAGEAQGEPERRRGEPGRDGGFPALDGLRR
jgi:hypothetical protein